MKVGQHTVLDCRLPPPLSLLDFAVLHVDLLIARFYVQVVRSLPDANHGRS